MRYAKIREMDISNGDGVGVSLFVQGCHFHCKGCFNPETWSFSGGNEWTKEAENDFFSLVSKPYIKRVSILGGEPLADENVEIVLRIIQKIRRNYPDKKIWVYTGYNWDEVIYLRDGLNLFRAAVLLASDFVVDGKFQIEKQDLFNEKTIWAGSTNQKVIQVRKQLQLREQVDNEKTDE